MGHGHLDNDPHRSLYNHSCSLLSQTSFLSLRLHSLFSTTTSTHGRFTDTPPRSLSNQDKTLFRKQPRETPLDDPRSGLTFEAILPQPTSLCPHQPYRSRLSIVIIHPSSIEVVNKEQRERRKKRHARSPSIHFVNKPRGTHFTDQTL